MKVSNSNINNAILIYLQYTFHTEIFCKIYIITVSYVQFDRSCLVALQRAFRQIGTIFRKSGKTGMAREAMGL